MPRSKSSEIRSGGTNWSALRVMSEDDIERAASEDADNPATDESHWANAVVTLPSGKTSIHASFDRDVVDFFRRDGRGYQTRMNAVLRRYMEAQNARRRAPR